MKKLLLIILILSSMELIFSDDLSGTTVFSTDILGEDDLYLSLEGSWNFDLSTFAEGNLTSAFSNLIFTQTPNVTASLWLFNMFFFETNITESNDDNIFILGYQNSQTLISELRIGNDDLNIGTYAGYTPPVNEDQAPGFRIKMESENTTHEVLGRYTTEESDKILYKGYNVKTIEQMDISSYVKGRYFIIPFRDISKISLYIEFQGDMDLLNEQDYTFDSLSNILIIDDDIEYDKLYLKLEDYSQISKGEELLNFVNPSKNPGILKELDIVDIENLYIKDERLLLYSNGAFSPFEFLGSYEFDNIDNSATYDFFINGIKSLNYRIDDSYLFITNFELDISDLKYRYPFLDEDPLIYSLGGSGLTSNYTVTLNSLEPVTSITVPSEVKENSVKIILNGISYTDFTHGKESGVITFNQEISPFDEIEISYKIDTFPGTANLLMAYGGKFQLSDDLTVELSNSGSWDFSDDSFSTTYNENIGEINSRAKLNYNSQYFKGELQSSIFVQNPDTLGRYLLFEYNTSSFNIPISSTVIGSSLTPIPLISRIYNNLYLTVSEIKELNIDPLGGAYYVNNIYGNRIYKSLVIETPALDETEKSSVVVDLDEYKRNYSFADEVVFDIYNDGLARDIEIRFLNPGLDDDQQVTKSITVEEDSGYNEYKIEFTDEERGKLLWLSDIEIILSEGVSQLFLLKGIEFSGDSIIKHSGSNNFYITKKNESLEIVSKSDNDGKDIVISSEISEIDLKKYGELNFKIENNGLLNDTSQIYFEFMKRGKSVSTLSLPGKYFGSSNEIKVNLGSKKIFNNNIEIADGLWSEISSGECDSITITISDYVDNASLELSKLVLENPELTIYSENSLKLNITPPLDIQIGDSEILSDLSLQLNNYLISVDGMTYKGDADISFNLLSSKFTGGVSYNSGIDSINYLLTLPNFSLPFTLTDKYYYSVNSNRTTSFKLEKDPLSIEISLSDTTGEDEGLRNSLLKTGIKREIFSLSNDINLIQKRDDLIGSINYEVSNSYLNLLPINRLENKTELKDKLEVNLGNNNIFLNIDILGKLQQETMSQRTDSKSYNINLETGYKIGYVVLKPQFTTKYSTNRNSSLTLLSKSIGDYFDDFIKSNPYSISIDDLLLSTSRDDFYNESSDYNKRDLESSVSLGLSNNVTINKYLDIFIPDLLTYKLEKSFIKNLSNETTLISHSIKGNFTKSNTLKNSLNFTNSYNIEKESDTFLLEWKLMYYNEVVKNTFLDIGNELSFGDEDAKNLLSIDLEIPGKSGPVLVLPLVDKVFDSPYNYTHKEGFYFSVEQYSGNVEVGARHETELNVKDMNKSNFFIDINYNNYDLNRLDFEIGLSTTLIF